MKGSVPTPPTKKKNGAKSRQSKVESTRFPKQQPNANRSVAKKDYTPEAQRAAHKEALAIRKKEKTTPKQEAVRYGEVRGRSNSTNGATNSARVQFDRSLSRIWFDWSNATMAAHSIRMEELMRCRSPMDFVTVGPRCALRSWFGVWLPLLAGQSGERH